MSTKGNDDGGSQMEPEANPYREPPLEKIFTYKDEQKELKLADQQRNASLKIWDKSRPKNEGLIRKINGIRGPSESEGKKPRQKESEGLLPGERRKRMEGKHELIDKKRDMFLLQMMLDLKKKEIQKMDDFKKLREQGLEYSEKMMEDDLQNVKRVVNDMKEECNRKINNAEAKAKENQRKEIDLKQIKEEISSLHNKINRGTDSLENGSKYMNFFLQLQTKDSAESGGIAQLLANKRAISKDPSQSLADPMSDKKGKRRVSTQAVSSLPEDMVAALSLRPELIDLINDPTTDYPLQFKAPAGLYEVFLNLEEQNTNLIMRMQELHQEIDKKKDHFNVMKSGKETQISRLLQSKEQLERAIREQKEHIHVITGPESQEAERYEVNWLGNIAKSVLLYAIMSR